MEDVTSKVCKCCGKELPIDSFYRNGWGATSVCKDCHVQLVAEGKEKKKKLKQQAVDAVNARNLRIQDFSPRELMEELKRRGYEFTITYTDVHTITSDKL